MRMDLVIDKLCFKDNKDRLVPEEVAVLALHKDFSTHWMVSPTCNSKLLRKYILRQNNWMTLNHHGLGWYEEDISVKNLYKNLREIGKGANKIYVRGEKKGKLLEKLTTRKVINLKHDNNCLPFQKLAWCEKYCMQHAVKHSYLQYSSALNNAFKLKTWLKTRGCVVDTGEFPFSPPLYLCDKLSAVTVPLRV